MTGSGAVGGGEGAGDGAAGGGELGGDVGGGVIGARVAERTRALKDFFATCPFERTVITAYTRLPPAPEGTDQAQTTLLALVFAFVTSRAEPPTSARQEAVDDAGSRSPTSLPLRAQPAETLAWRSSPAFGRAGAVVGCPRIASVAGGGATAILNERTTGVPL